MSFLTELNDDCRILVEIPGPQVLAGLQATAERQDLSVNQLWYYSHDAILDIGYRKQDV